MKITFWMLFLYFTIALILEILVPIRRFMFVGSLDIIFAVALLRHRISIKPGEMIILIVLFILFNNRPEGFLDVACDCVFVIASFIYLKHEYQVKIEKLQ